jgi:hypothetical protein
VGGDRLGGGRMCLENHLGLVYVKTTAQSFSLLHVEITFSTRVYL